MMQHTFVGIVASKHDPICDVMTGEVHGWQSDDPQPRSGDPD